MKLGAHKSISGGYDQAVKRVNDIGGNCLQIFSASPRRWSFAEKTDQEIDQFNQTRNKLEVDPIFFHASYLINLANFSEVATKSKKSLINELTLASELDIKGSIVHTGSFKTRNKEEIRTMEGYDKLIKNIGDVLKKIPDDAYFIAENSANKKIGRNLEDLQALVEDVKHQQFRICLDTCHLHASGYDLSTKEKFKGFLEEFDQKIGLDKLELWHLNDSKDEMGDFRDRHENIGEGNIDKDVFKFILQYPQTRDLPLIIETPGFDGDGPDKKNIRRLQQLKG